MSATLIGPELEKTENLPRIKLLMNNKKRLSQKLVILKNIEHPLPLSKRRVTYSTNLLPPLKTRMTQLTK